MWKNEGIFSHRSRANNKKRKNVCTQRSEKSSPSLCAPQDKFCCRNLFLGPGRRENGLDGLIKKSDEGAALEFFCLFWFSLSLSPRLVTINFLARKFEAWEMPRFQLSAQTLVSSSKHNQLLIRKHFFLSLSLGTFLLETFFLAQATAIRWEARKKSFLKFNYSRKTFELFSAVFIHRDSLSLVEWKILSLAYFFFWGRLVIKARAKK